MRRPTSARCGRSTRTPTWRRRRCSWSPTGWAATPAATSRAGSSSRSSPSWPTARHDPRSGAAAVAELLERCQSRINQYAIEQRLGGADRWYAGTTAVVALLVVDDGVPEVAARQPRRLPDLPARRRRARTGLRRPLGRAGAAGRREHHRRRRGHPSRAARRDPRARRPRRRRGRLLPAPAPDGRAAAALLRRHQRHGRRRRDRGGARPRAATRATRPTGWCPRRWRPVVATTPRPSWSMWWDG